MPRNIELDDEVLLGCFTRAFGAVDANNKVDKTKLAKLAKEWNSYIDNVKFESESTMKTIREIFRKKLPESQSQNKAGQGRSIPRPASRCRAVFPACSCPPAAARDRRAATTPPGRGASGRRRAGARAAGGNNPP